MHLSEIKVSTTEISGLVYLLYINHFCFTSYFSSVIHAPPAVALDPLPPPPPVRGPLVYRRCHVMRSIQCADMSKA